MSRVAAIDCGTNSLRLLVADDTPDGLRDVLRRVEVVRLGSGVDRTGLLDEAAVARTLTVLAEYAGTCADLDVRRLRFVGTSASRDAANAGPFVAAVRRLLAPWGAEPEVIGGAAEAGLSFLGATADLPGIGLEPPHLIVDLGGGSTELALGETVPRQAISLDIGSVRLHERFRFSDPPTAAELAAATALIDEQLDAAAAVLDLGTARSLVGLAGTVGTITAHALALPAYLPEVVHLANLPAATITLACTDLIGRTHAERAALPYLQAGREDVIGAGALVWRSIIERVRDVAGLDRVVSSEHDILDGIAASLASPRPA